MSKLISEILGISGPSFFLQIEELERLSHRPGVDIRLSSELQQLFKEKTRLVGLDENDTTAEELYFATARLALKESDELAKSIGVEENDSSRQMVEKSIGFVEKRLGTKNIWALKPSVTRKQLKDNPPKKLMKTFGIRSIDSVLKRERVSMLYCFAKFSEPPSWFAKYSAQAAKLTNSDFDNQILQISVVPDERCNQLSKTGIKLSQIIYFDQESAAIEVCPPSKRFKGDVLFLIEHLFQQIKDMLRRSAYYKTQGLKPGFFTKLGNIRSNGFAAVETENYPFDWPTVVYATTELGIPGLIQADEPFLSNEELIVPSLSQLINADFWKQPFAVYRQSPVTIPFNLSDMVINAINNTPPEQAYIENAKINLKNELFARYLKHEPLRNHLANLNEYEA